MGQLAIQRRQESAEEGPLGEGGVGDDQVGQADAQLAALAEEEEVGVGPARAPAVGRAAPRRQLRRLGELRGMGRAILVGASRKSTIGYLLDGAPPEQRLEGSLALAVLAAAAGAHMVRVHDVAETVRATRVADAVVRGTPEHVLELPPPGRTG